jgi:hypothetical protein
MKALKIMNKVKSFRKRCFSSASFLKELFRKMKTILRQELSENDPFIGRNNGILS